MVRVYISYNILVHSAPYIIQPTFVREHAGLLYIYYVSIYIVLEPLSDVRLYLVKQVDPTLNDVSSFAAKYDVHC